MKSLWIATGNAHKLQEFRAMLEPLGYEIKGMQDLDVNLEVEENGTTFEENALIKARALHERTHMSVISDDSGLCVNAMNGEPGVHSARFMGYDSDYALKNRAIIEQVKQSADKRAQFVCAIAYIEADGTEHVFRGVVEGIICETAIGAHGFGYDPIFYYPPYQTTLANVNEEEKNKVSHRFRALQQLIAYLEGPSL